MFQLIVQLGIEVGFVHAIAPAEEALETNNESLMGDKDMILRKPLYHLSPKKQQGEDSKTVNPPTVCARNPNQTS